MYNKYFYITLKRKAPIYITAKRKPSVYTIPKNGTWIVREWYENGWYLPCLPEITWEILKTFQYIGKIKNNLQ